VKILFVTYFLALGAQAGSVLTGNAPLELSSPGGNFTIGTGNTLTQFTILPFDVTLNSDGSPVTIPEVGSVTLPQVQDGDDPLLAGLLQITFGDIRTESNVYAMTLDWGDGLLNFGVQVDGIYVNDNEHVEFHFDSAIGAPETQQTFGMEARFIDSVPEPGTWMLVGLGALGLAIKATVGSRSRL